MVTKVLLITAAVVAVLFIGWHVFIALRIGTVEQANRGLVDFSTLRLTEKPNQFLLAPPGTTPAAPMAEAPVFPAPPERLRDAVLAVIGEAPRTRILDRSPDGMAFTAVQQTALMRYPDFISVEIRPAGDGGSTLLVYSRSVFGHSDLGVNKARIEGWLADAKARIGG